MAKKTVKSGSKALSEDASSSAASEAGATGGSHRVDEVIRSLGDWRADTLTRLRRLIHEAEPEIAEECKWVKASNPLGVPVWSRNGIVCTGESYKQSVKLTFPIGASLPDPKGLFNSSLEGGTRRAIDVREGESLDADAFKALIKAAVEENTRALASKSRPRRGGSA